MTTTGTETSSAVSLVTQRIPHGVKAAEDGRKACHQLKSETCLHFLHTIDWVPTEPETKASTQFPSSLFQDHGLLLDYQYLLPIPAK